MPENRCQPLFFAHKWLIDQPSPRLYKHLVEPQTDVIEQNGDAEHRRICSLCQGLGPRLVS